MSCGEHDRYFSGLMANLYEINLGEDSWHINRVFTGPVSLGMTRSLSEPSVPAQWNSLRVEKRTDMSMLAN